MPRVSGPSTSFSILLILCLSFLSSCTVTKRVHKKGYYIEWNHSSKKIDPRHNTNVESTRKSRKNLNDVSVNHEIDSLLDIARVQANNIFQASDSSEDDTKRLSLNSSRRPDNNPNLSHALTVPEIQNIQIADGKTYPPNERFDSEKLKIIAGILIGLGVMLVIASFILVFGYPTLENLFAALVFSGNGFVVGFFGFILFLIIVATLILFVLLVEGLGGSTFGFILGSLFIIMGLILISIAYQN